MKIIVIDGQGGGVGRSLVEQIKKALPEEEVLAVGTNAVATANMMKAGADGGATGENAVIYNCRHADVITGPFGIILANSIHGEISKEMAYAVADSDAFKMLIPSAKCSVIVAGLAEKPLSKYIEEAVEAIKAHLDKK